MVRISRAYSKWALADQLASKSTSTTKRSGPLAPGVAFVTGGARGLGNAIAVSFAREGARGVVIVDINPETLNEGKKTVEAYGTPVILSISIFPACSETIMNPYSKINIVSCGPSRRDKRRGRRESHC
jgi:shikimate 5-dehydrogenase